MRIWVDLANSPHVPFFVPVVRALRERGHEVIFTARDHAQTLELAEQAWDGVEVIGRSSPGHAVPRGEPWAGARSTWPGGRAAAQPELALSHQSYGQMLAARAVRLPAVTAMDFEHQPLNHLAFRLARGVILPRAMKGGPAASQGATDRKTAYYDGLKEELYLGDFEPDRSVTERAGLPAGDDRILVVARTPPSRATYHHFGNDLFTDTLSAVGARPEAVCVVLARFPEQRKEILDMGLNGVIVPARALDARSLMYAADVVLGAGGTMTREAALLGVPTYSLFAGRRPAVDDWLEQRGLLTRLETVDQLLPLRRREREPIALDQLRRRGDGLVDWFVDHALAVSGQATPRPGAIGARA